MAAFRIMHASRQSLTDSFMQIILESLNSIRRSLFSEAVLVPAKSTIQKTFGDKSLGASQSRNSLTFSCR